MKKRVNPRALAEHVAELAEKHKIIVKRRKDRSNSLAYFQLREIHIPPIRGEKSYFTALHEIGHLVTKANYRKGVLHDEARAWQWALEAALIKPRSPTLRYIDFCLSSYLVTRQLDELPKPNDIFWTTLTFVREEWGRFIKEALGRWERGVKRRVMLDAISNLIRYQRSCDPSLAGQKFQLAGDLIRRLGLGLREAVDLVHESLGESPTGS